MESRYGWILLSGKFALRALTILDDNGRTQDYYIAMAHSNTCWKKANPSIGR